MATSYTSLIGLALPVTGELSGTWGDTVNNYISTYIDSAVAGTQTISGSQTAVTLSVTNGSSLSQAGSGATGSAQYTIINCTGNPAGTLTITAPASSKSYIIINSTSTSQSVKIVGAGPTTGVTVASGDKALVAWSGADFVRIGASAGGTNTQVQYNNNGNLAGSASMTFDSATGKLTVGNILDSGLTASQAVLTDASKNLVSVATTGTGSVVLATAPTLTLANATGLPLSTGVSGQLPVANGGTGANNANGGFNALSPMTTAGDIIYGGVSGAGTRLGIGSNGYVLTVSSGAPVWAASSGGSPGGSSGQVQYNNGSGGFGGSANLTFDGTTLTAAGLAGPLNGTVGATTPAAGSFTTLAASSTVSGTGFSTYLASPPAIGGTAAAAGTFTQGSFSSTVHRGATSGTVTMTAPAVAGTQSYTLPTALPTVSGQTLSCTTGGVMSWASSAPTAPTSVEYLVVAGGGGGGADFFAGGRCAGGGGAGGYLTATGYAVSVGSPITVTVGGGGAGGSVSTTGNNGVNGTSSVFGSISTVGGGGGQGHVATPPLTAPGVGGSGGGARNGENGAAGTSGQGNAGGNGNANTSPYTGGGGGGAGAAGGNAVTSTAGSGGAGLDWNSLGTFYAGGGGGSAFTGGTAGAGGSSIGGAGAVYSSGGNNASPANRGSGGGGGVGTGGNGSGGIVIVRYADTYAAATSSTGSPTITTSGGYRYYTWTGNGSITF